MLVFSIPSLSSTSGNSYTNNLRNEEEFADKSNTADRIIEIKTKIKSESEYGNMVNEKKVPSQISQQHQLYSVKKEKASLNLNEISKDKESLLNQMQIQKSVELKKSSSTSANVKINNKSQDTSKRGIDSYDLTSLLIDRNLKEIGHKDWSEICFRIKLTEQEYRYVMKEKSKKIKI